jgi:hypothetical protein
MNETELSLQRGLTTPEETLRFYEQLAILDGDHKRAKGLADRIAANHYRVLLGDAFFRRLHNTWTSGL